MSLISTLTAELEEMREEEILHEQIYDIFEEETTK